MKKSKDVEAWLLQMNKIFRLHDYSENIKVGITTFSLKGKATIWWENMKNFKHICEEELTWSDFEILSGRSIYLKDTMMIVKWSTMSSIWDL